MKETNNKTITMRYIAHRTDAYMKPNIYKYKAETARIMRLFKI